MAKRMILITTAILILAQTSLYAQDFKAEQKKQQKVIEQAYKKKKVSELEYNKLMNEQEVIKETIAKFEADDVLTAKEKNAIHAKLERAEKRLRKYKTNNEVY